MYLFLNAGSQNIIRDSLVSTWRGCKRFRWKLVVGIQPWVWPIGFVHSKVWVVTALHGPTHDSLCCFSQCGAALLVLGTLHHWMQGYKKRIYKD